MTKYFPGFGGIAMKKKKLCKYFLSFSLLLLFTLLIPFTALNVTTVQAASIEIEKSDSYRLNLKSITLVKDKSYALKVYNLGESAKVTYKSDNEEIASANNDGIITANKIGTAIVTVTIKDGKTVTPLTCDITVGPPAYSVKLTKSRIVIGIDNTDFLNVILKPTNTVEDARFYSNDYSIASVSPSGRVTGKKLGLTYLFAKIEAKDNDGFEKYSRCTIIVTSQEDASLLDTYLAGHTELYFIPEDELSKALDNFFNVDYDATSSVSLVSSLNRYLEDKFNLAILRSLVPDLSKLQSNSAEIISAK